MEEAVTKISIFSSTDPKENGKVLLRTIKGNDGDLFESTWRLKMKHYLHFFRHAASPKVITDLKMIKDDEPIPDGYSGLFLTEDTMEKAFRKNVLCFKSDLRLSAAVAVVDIVLVHTGKREVPPSGYSRTNEVNDIQIAFKLQNFTKVKPISGSPHTVAKEIPVQANDHSLASSSVPRSPVSPLDGVPFQINPKFNGKDASYDPLVSGLRLLTLDEINSQFNYNFETEERVSASS